MTRRTRFICDGCGQSVEAFNPHGWRRISYTSQELRGQLATEQRGDVCSDVCELMFIKKKITEPLEQELKENQ